MSVLRYRPDIDGLRAVAVLLVVVFHFFPSSLPGGFIGVDVFFVISGFLITSIIIKEHEQNTFTVWGFYQRRILRIFPALISIFTAVLVAGWFTLFSSEYSMLARHVDKSMFFIQNIQLLKETGYFDISSNLKPLLHLWSLSLEEQFYVIWPLLIIVLLRFRKNLPLIVFLLTLVSFIINIVQVHSNAPSVFFLLHTRFWELSSGGLLAYFSTKETSRAFKYTKWFSKKGVRESLALISLACIVGPAFYLSEQSIFPGWNALFPVLGSVILIGSAQNTKVGNYLSHPLCVGIGLISYPLYLWHWPLISFVRILSPVTRAENSPYVLLALVLSFLFAYLTYIFLEKTINSKQNYTDAPWYFNSKNKRVGLLLLAYVSLLVTAKVIRNNEGFPLRAAAKNDRIINKFEDPKYTDCTKTINIPGLHRCHTSSSHVEQADIVIIGDSHADAMAPAFFKNAEHHGRKIHVLVTGGTVNFYKTSTKYITFGRETRTLTPALEWAVAHRAKKVVLVARGPVYYYKKNYKTPTSKIELMHSDFPNETDHKITYLEGLKSTLSYLAENNIQTEFVYDTPDVGMKPADACSKRYVSLDSHVAPKNCSAKRQGINEYRKEWRTAVDAVFSKYPQVQLYDPTPYLCNEDICPLLKGDVLLYADEDHVTPDGAYKLKNILLLE